MTGLNCMLPTSGILANAKIKILGCLWSWSARVIKGNCPKMIKYAKEKSKFNSGH